MPCTLSKVIEYQGIAEEVKEFITPISATPCVGDIVMVSRATGSSFSRAVVTKVHDKHCTAVTLENDTAYTTGEVWPFFEDLQIKDSSFRLGARVCVKGLRKPEMQPLNDAFGTIAVHKSQGHPVFVTKRNAAAGVLTYCVRLDHKTGGKKLVLLEPQFLVSEEQVLLEAENDLSAALSLLVPNVHVATDPVDTDSAATPEKEAQVAEEKIIAGGARIEEAKSKAEMEARALEEEVSEAPEVGVQPAEALEKEEASEALESDIVPTEAWEIEQEYDEPWDVTRSSEVMLAVWSQQPSVGTWVLPRLMCDIQPTKAVGTEQAPEEPEIDVQLAEALETDSAATPEKEAQVAEEKIIAGGARIEEAKFKAEMEMEARPIEEAMGKAKVEEEAKSKPDVMEEADPELLRDLEVIALSMAGSDTKQIDTSAPFSQPAQVRESIVTGKMEGAAVPTSSRRVKRIFALQAAFAVTSVPLLVSGAGAVGIGSFLSLSGYAGLAATALKVSSKF